MLTKEEAKLKLEELIREYKRNTNFITKRNITEETIRGYLNRMLEIFGWNVLDTNEIIQEKKLVGEQRERLREINSTHVKPDYQLMRGKNIQAFLDAKDLNVNLIEDRNVAFQIRSYGWSAQVPCSFVSNFEQFGIYDCRFEPNPNQEANYGTGTIFLSVDEYIEKYDVLYDFLHRDSMYNGRLQGIYERLGHIGEHSLDYKFMRTISQFRLALARNLLKNNPYLDEESYGDLNYFIQVIMDRIIFIRVCESKGIEQEGLLKNFQERGFWDVFKTSCYMEFFEHYDGAMFERDNRFNDLVIDDEVFNDFIDNLYYPTPYRFDTIPVALLAEIYEYFLAKKIEVENEEIIERWKGIYQKSQGAVSTPKYLVEFICEKTINPQSFSTIEEVLNAKILEPACGSGTFLISAYELLEKRLIELYNEGNIDGKYEDWFFQSDDSVYMTVHGKRELMKSCIYGIDIDETAIEVTKMSLALKIIDNINLIVLNEVGVYGERILRDIHNNIINGNTLVETDFLDNDVPESEIYEANPLDINNTFNEIIGNGGFSFVIGNPPYVEPKHYTKLYPNMYEYIKNKYQIATGKGDISLYFIKRSLDLLAPNGKIGFIIQKRFFKTEYGKNIRDILSSNGYLEEVIDFKSNDIFKGRITYVAFMLISKQNNDNVNYKYVLPEHPIEVKNLIENCNLNHLGENFIKTVNVSNDQLIGKTWSYDIFSIANLIEKLRNRGISNMGSVPGLEIKTGVQVLWNQVYRLENCQVNDGIVTGTNRFGEHVCIEVGMVKKLIVNKHFYCFKGVETDTYILFPYRGEENRELITMSEVEEEFPLAFNYLLQNETRIKGNVRYIDNDQEWHGYTRIQGHYLFEERKIIMPMTARDTIVSFIGNEGAFADNANMWQIVVEEESEEFMKALACIMNSTTFSAFAKIEANPQQNGNFKFNKQFIEPVLFPYNNLITSSNHLAELVRLHDDIKRLQLRYRVQRPGQRNITANLLQNNWSRVDEITDELYGLTDEDKALISQYGRIDRVELIY